LRIQSWTFLSILLLATPFSLAAQESEQSPNSDVVLEYARNPDNVVVTFDIVGAFRDATPLLRIYGDGRVRVHRQREGDLEMWLDDSELTDLVERIYSSGLLTTDTQLLRQSAEEILDNSQSNRPGPW